MIPKQQIMDDITKKNAGSDFHPLKQQIDEYQGEEIPVIYDYEFQYDKNFYICLSNELKSFMSMVYLILQEVVDLCQFFYSYPIVWLIPILLFIVPRVFFSVRLQIIFDFLQLIIDQ